MSSLLIEFTNTWQTGDSLKIQFGNNGVLTSQIFVWVNTRSGSLEVTASSGATANNFKTAFNLDNPSGYTTSVQDSNSVLIESQTSDEYFNTVVFGNANHGQANITIQNTSSPPLNLFKVLTRSPYYITIPWYYPTNSDIKTYYIIKLFVWSGDITSVPATPKYEIQKDNVLNAGGSEKIDIGRLLNDFIDFTPSRNAGTQIYNANTNCKFYRAEVYYESLSTPQIIREGVFMQGYAYGYEGENKQPPADRVYLLNREYDVGENTVFIIPVETEASGLNFSVISYPDNKINITGNTGVNSESNSNTFVQYISVDVSEAEEEKYIEILYGGNLLSYPTATKITLYITHEDIFTPYDVYFQNKQGHLQTLTFFKERKDTLSTTSENYNSNNGQPSLGIHQFVDYNKNATKPFKMSTGFVDESINEDITQLLLSEKVYLYENNLMTPVNVTQNSLSYKNRVNDKLVDYVLDFKYSFNMINNI